MHLRDFRGSYRKPAAAKAGRANGRLYDNCVKLAIGAVVRFITVPGDSATKALPSDARAGG